jgi:hypothetical protein
MMLAVAGITVFWLCTDDSSPAPRAQSQPMKPQADGKQADREQADGKQADGKHKVYFGNRKACGTEGCHGRMMPAGPGEELVGDVSAVLSRRHELQLWETQDKHKIATKVLLEGRGQRMAELLGIKGDITDPAKNHAWRQCLSCHGVIVEDEKQADKKSFAPKDRIDSGVSCVVCHAPYAEWVVEHSRTVLNKWQDFTREEKEATYGLRDLWDSRRRADLCSSCHVGSVAEGKVVTHEMYAAGHPPLPGFEIVTFSDAMPRHWETLPEKYQRLPKAREVYDRVYHFGDDYQQQQLRLLVTSAVVAFRHSAQLVAVHAQAAQKPGNDRSWPEFALYDCNTCHHDLKAESWRQQRGYAGKPGRPQMRDWSTALLPLAMRHEQPRAATMVADFPKRLASLRGAFSNSPFGDPSEVFPKAAALVEWSDAMLKQLQESRFDRGESAKLLAALVDGYKKDLLDFDSARQIGWAIHALIKEGSPGTLKDANLKEPLARMTDQLNLMLLKGQQPIWPSYVHETMAKVAAYDAVEFRNHLGALARALPKR